jgi:hypothetical protein
MLIIYSVCMNSHVDEQKSVENPNHELELALVRIARVLFDYAKSQQTAGELRRLHGLYSAFEHRYIQTLA